MKKKTKAAKKPRGRPSRYSKAIAAKICAELETGRTLRDVCRDDGMPAQATVHLWRQSQEGFAEQYAQARETGYLLMADEIVEIADDGSNDWMENKHGEEVLDGEHVQRSKLRVDTRKWLLSKALPKIFGDKLALTDPEGGKLTVQLVQFADSPNP